MTYSDKLISFVRDHYQTDHFIPLHEPRFRGNEKKYLLDTINSFFVSFVGSYVNKFEEMMQDITHCQRDWQENAPFLEETIVNIPSSAR